MRSKTIYWLNISPFCSSCVTSHTQIDLVDRTVVVSTLYLLANIDLDTFIVDTAYRKYEISLHTIKSEHTCISTDNLRCGLQLVTSVLC